MFVVLQFKFIKWASMFRSV